MKNPERVAQLLAELRELTDNDFERHRIDVLKRDLTAPPTVEIIDDTHQRFNGIVYNKSLPCLRKNFPCSKKAQTSSVLFNTLFHGGQIFKKN